MAQAWFPSLPLGSARFSFALYARNMSSKTENFHASRGRWFWNNDINRKIRYTPFNIEGLQGVATQVASAQRCTSMVRIGEGSLNKVFLLQFDNGKEMLARIPCPVVGNLPLSTASEAATMEYVRLRYLSNSAKSQAFPKVPRVFAWDSSFENPAAWPYILCEYLPGVTFDNKWADINGHALKDAIHDIVMFGTEILQETFSQHGSIYFADSVSEELRERPLYSEPPTDPLRMDLARRFRIGPTVNREWWRGAYGEVTADRGPWSDFPTMITSAAKFQLQCLESGIDHSSPFSESTATDIPLLRRMLNICIDIAPFLAPKNQFWTSIRRPVLNHPDLSLCNFIVPSEGEPKIQGIIDWQGACVGPFFMQCQPATGLIYNTAAIECASDGSPITPDNFDSLSTEEQDAVRGQMDLLSRYRDYHRQVGTSYPNRHDAWNLPIPSLLRFIVRCIADGPMELCDLLIKTQEMWFLFSDEPCPIDFSLEEQEMYRAQHEEWYKRVLIDSDLANAVGCVGDGWISDENFEDANQRWNDLRRLWDKEMDRPFPYFDGAPSPYLS
ncbi:hypothetical protein M413DRAFT_379687 [Hebeloma cylindrosporum]|uniref:Altered inheritance of mitochondria protein 9, mitochondrial n=1 Tax=Hebeloma cylindrosporum TaxID=76867 RepID=A0A0C3CKP1_HEBCY|nr:hypothetical protein M413DRAFT_379687 [Hebeloma cylindrosporum h7]